MPWSTAELTPSMSGGEQDRDKLHNIQLSNNFAAETIPMRQCQHDKDGVCSIHGEGAKEMWKPAPTITRGKDGALRRRKGRVSYYVCEEGRVGRGGKLTQTKMSSFFKTGGGGDTRC